MFGETETTISQVKVWNHPIYLKQPFVSIEVLGTKQLNSCHFFSNPLLRFQIRSELTCPVCSRVLLGRTGWKPEQWKKGPWLFRVFLGDDLFSYMGITICHYKDPVITQPGFQWKSKKVFVSWLTPVNLAPCFQVSCVTTIAVWHVVSSPPTLAQQRPWKITSVSKTQ